MGMLVLPGAAGKTWFDVVRYGSFLMVRMAGENWKMAIGWECAVKLRADVLLYLTNVNRRICEKNDLITNCQTLSFCGKMIAITALCEGCCVCSVVICYI
jgi:hypothetical protein